ncbi:MAG: ABC transporter ATP-binding protein [Actinobacteria bacterium]|nr:ABC transporter ATP-binding protein [Actinomycetota bacterium]
MNVALRCRELSKRFGDVQAVDDVSFEVAEGSLFALLGPSGCGKTTVLRLIAGLETPDAGLIEIAGSIAQSARTQVPPERRHVGLVFQDYALFPHLDVRANVAFGLAGANGRDARVDEVLAQVGLTELARRMPDELSGGQQQRVALARALAPRPRLVLLDEPYSNLDAALRVGLRLEVRAILRAAGATAVFVTHDQEEALSLADVVGVMMEGRLVQIGTATEVYRRPASRVVAEFIGEVNLLPGQGIGRAVVCDLGTVVVPEPLIGPVDVLVRPEALRLSADPRGQGVVTGHAFYGHDQIVHVRLDSGLRLQCRTGPGFDQPDGARVRVQLEGDALAFRR